MGFFGVETAVRGRGWLSADPPCCRTGGNRARPAQHGLGKGRMRRWETTSLNNQMSERIPLDQKALDPVYFWEWLPSLALLF